MLCRIARRLHCGLARGTDLFRPASPCRRPIAGLPDANMSSESPYTMLRPPAGPDLANEAAEKTRRPLGNSYKSYYTSNHRINVQQLRWQRIDERRRRPTGSRSTQTRFHIVPVDGPIHTCTVPFTLSQQAQPAPMWQITRGLKPEAGAHDGAPRDNTDFVLLHSTPLAVHSGGIKHYICAPRPYGLSASVIKDQCSGRRGCAPHLAVCCDARQVGLTARGDQPCARGQPLGRGHKAQRPWWGEF